MGASVGEALTSLGHEVLWASAGRSSETKERAKAAGCIDAKDTSALTSTSEVILSICPPHAAIDVARDIAGGFRGLFVDFNAISPARAREVASTITEHGATYVDGGIIGGPASPSLYVSGPEAGEAQALFESSDRLRCVDLGDSPTAASSLKMCFASYTKGQAALLVAIRGLALSLGVEDALLEEWDESMGDLRSRSDASVLGVLPKAWRFEGEMEEIADTFLAEELPDGFHRAAAEIYRRLKDYKGSSAGSVEEVLRKMIED
jgi:3-hydroxyisobutyrate dehydrogenase-like beta-hydroxyacid dehydrogenase